MIILGEFDLNADRSLDVGGRIFAYNEVLKSFSGGALTVNSSILDLEKQSGEQSRIKTKLLEKLSASPVPTKVLKQWLIDTKAFLYKDGARDQFAARAFDAVSGGATVLLHEYSDFIYSQYADLMLSQDLDPSTQIDRDQNYIDCAAVCTSSLAYGAALAFVIPEYEVKLVAMESGTFSTEPPQNTSGGTIKKLKWLANTAHLAMIIQALVEKGYLQVPSKKGSINGEGTARALMEFLDFENTTSVGALGKKLSNTSTSLISDKYALDRLNKLPTYNTQQLTENGELSAKDEIKFRDELKKYIPNKNDI